MEFHGVGNAQMVHLWNSSSEQMPNLNDFSVVLWDPICVREVYEFFIIEYPRRMNPSIENLGKSDINSESEPASLWVFINSNNRIALKPFPQTRNWFLNQEFSLISSGPTILYITMRLGVWSIHRGSSKFSWGSQTSFFV